MISAFALCLLFSPATVDPSPAQLRELEVTPEEPPETIPVFRNHPDEAAVIIFSSLTDLQIESNMGIVEDLSRPADGRYVLMLGPFRQILTVRSPGFQETRITVPNMSAREVSYYSVEPREREPVEGRGILILRSIPEGARISVDGIPDFVQYTPYTFTDWSAQSYRMRVELDKYEPREFIISIPEGRTATRTLELVPDHGFVTVHEQGTLRVRYQNEGSLSRTSYTPGSPLELPVGNHTLELSRDYYQTESTEVLIDPGETTSWRPESHPLYGQLRVQANTEVNVEVEDNQAPSPPPGADYLYVEAGRKRVRVSAPDYVAEEFSIDMPASGRMDTTLTLVSVSEARELERRREQPRGVIMAAADIAATEIWINGELAGRGFVNQGVLTGSHTIEFRHSSGTRTESVYVAPAEMEQVYVELRPSRSVAISRSALFPGSGHLYTDRSRGYLYGSVFLGAVAGSALMWLRYQDIDNDFQQARDHYRQAESIEEAGRYHREMFDLHDDRVKSHNLLTYMVLGTAAVYTVNLLDILLTRPEYGYRTGLLPERFSLNVIPSEGNIPMATVGYKWSF